MAGGWAAFAIEETWENGCTPPVPIAIALGANPILQGAARFDLHLIDSKTLDGNIQELTYVPTLHV